MQNFRIYPKRRELPTPNKFGSFILNQPEALMAYHIVNLARKIQNPPSTKARVRRSGRGRFFETRKTPLKRLSQRADDNTFFFQMLHFFFCKCYSEYYFYSCSQKRAILAPVYLHVVVFTQNLLRRNSEAVGICDTFFPFLFSSNGVA